MFFRFVGLGSDLILVGVGSGLGTDGRTLLGCEESVRTMDLDRQKVGRLYVHRYGVQLGCFCAARGLGKL